MVFALPWAATLVLFGLAGCGLDTSPLIVRLFGPPRTELREAYALDPARATVDHALLDRVLKAHVQDGRVDYGALKAAPGDLDAYLAVLADAPFGDLDRDGKLALLINAYNAFTLKLMIDHGPVASIQDIPAGERWDAERWTLGGRTVSLTAIEHEELRTKFVEPRVHFAINCASVGCPPLRGEAYVPERLDAQLEDQARTIHGDVRWLRVQHNSALKHHTVHLTRLYLWYADDFAQVDGTPLAFASRWVPELGEGRWEIAWLDYDWSVNGSW